MSVRQRIGSIEADAIREKAVSMMPIHVTPSSTASIRERA